MKFSVTPKCFFISALVFAAVLMFAACSGEKAAGSVSLELPGRSAFSRDAASMYVTVFITGDYQDEQTFAMDDDGLTVTFDSVPSGASIRVACALTFENPLVYHNLRGFFAVRSVAADWVRFVYYSVHAVVVGVLVGSRR